MKVSEYSLLLEAWERSFGFMLNRMCDTGLIDGDPHAPEKSEAKGRAEDLCFNEFMCALEEMGVELADVEAPIKGLPRPDERDEEGEWSSW